VDDGDESGDSYMLDAKYEAMTNDTHEVTEAQKHLSGTQKSMLEKDLAKYPELFDQKLSLYPHRQVHLEVDPKVAPFHSRLHAAPS
jgi:hypothetical protein